MWHDYAGMSTNLVIAQSIVTTMLQCKDSNNIVRMNSNLIEQLMFKAREQVHHSVLLF